MPQTKKQSSKDESAIILTFADITRHDATLAGGKGASLGEMLRAGISVPDGFVITANAFIQFIENSGLESLIQTIVKTINYQDTALVDQASQKIRVLMSKAKFPVELEKSILAEFKKLKADYVAVRSSATAEDSKTASWAGELETYLNTTEKTLIQNIKKCWSSLYTPRALFYRAEKKLLDTPVLVAVVVQKMIQSEISGICFTVHPVTGDYDRLIIEAGYGLGEAIVGGKITPDTYIIKKSTLRQAQGIKNRAIIDKNISEQKMMIVMNKKKNGTEEVDVPKSQQEKQKLTDEKIIELAKICLDIEKHYGQPQDIEWAME